MSFLDPFEGRIYALMRIVVGLLFLCHGLQKLVGLFGGAPAGMPAPLLYAAGAIELVGGALVMVGFLTRPAAFICSGTMAVAYFLVHHKLEALFPIDNQGELAALYAWVFLFIAAHGAGRWSVDGERAGATRA